MWACRRVAARWRILVRRPGGKSGLHRAACRLTAGGARSQAGFTESATENVPPVARALGARVGGKGEKVR